MRRLTNRGVTWVLAVAMSMALAGCGRTSDPIDVDVAKEPANLQAVGWVGGAPVALTGEADALRAVFFLDLNSAAAAAQARRLSRLGAEHPALILVGATKDRDREAAEAFRERTGFPGPVALGITAEVLEHYHIEQRPALRVIGKHGDVVGREVITLMAHLGRPKTDVATR